MSLEFPVELRDPRLPVILEFLREATVALDERVPLPRRAALAVKWCVVLEALGLLDGSGCDPPPDPEGLLDRVKRMLRAAAYALRSGTLSAPAPPGERGW